GLLGPERHPLSELISESSGESRDVAATRVWTALECLKKADVPSHAPLLLASSAPQGWVFLSSGRLTIGTFVATLRNSAEPIVFAVLLGNGPRMQENQD